MVLVMRSTYKDDDVILLLKDITGLVEPQGAEEREKLIQSGRHYSEMLPIEYVPSEKYMSVYKEALENYSEVVARAVACLSEKIYNLKSENVVLVSLARAGIPIGILVKHFLERKYNIKTVHYSISIIRGRGIDKNAMKYILDRHKPSDILFVDGWIGKGAITNSLVEAMKDYEGVSAELAVISDPANITELYGTREDILIPSSCLNCTVSGLISRTFLRDDIIGENDFHGAVYYGELKDNDLSYEFIDSVEKYYDELINSDNSLDVIQKDTDLSEDKGIDEVRAIAKEFGVADINLIKPGIGEATRVLLRRVPWRILVDERYFEADELRHLFRLAKEKNVEVVAYPLRHYKACGIIKKMADT